jgi:hypothetical protein
MSGETFHKILEPYLFAIGLTVLILLGAFALLYRDGQKRRRDLERPPYERLADAGRPGG